MKKSVFGVADIHKCGIQAGCKLGDFAKVDVSDRKIGFAFFIVDFHQRLVFQQGDFHLFRGAVNNKFPIHIIYFLGCFQRWFVRFGKAGILQGYYAAAQYDDPLSAIFNSLNK